MEKENNGESKMTPEVENAIKAAAKNVAHKAVDPTDDLEALRELLDTPLTMEEAKKALATNDVDKMKLLVIRQKWETQQSQIALNLASLDEKLRLLDMDRAVILRRTLNATGETK